MAFISDAKHMELDNQLLQFLLNSQKTDFVPADIESLKKDRILLEQMYVQYQEKVNELLTLIGNYQQVYRRTRVLLRKQQLSSRLREESFTGRNEKRE